MSLEYGKFKPTDTFFFDQNMADNGLDVVKAFAINGQWRQNRSNERQKTAMCSHLIIFFF